MYMDAESWFEHAKEQIELQNYQKAEDLLKNAIQFKPDFVEAYQELSIVSIHRGKFDQAKQYYEKLLDLQPTVERQVQYAGILLMVDEPKKAEHEFQEILNDNPENVDAKKGLADSFFRQKNFKEAISTYKSILDEYPENAFIWYSLAETYYRAQDHEAALEAIDEAIKLETAPEFFAFKGDFYIRHDNFERALEQYRLATNFDPRDPELRMRLGFIYRVLDRPNDALDAFDHALDIDPYLSEALENKIEILEALGNIEAARAVTEQLVRVQPENVKLGLNLAHHYMDNNGYKRASEIFEILIEENRRNPEIWYGLAYSMFQIEEYERAQEAIEMAILSDKEEVEEYQELKNQINTELADSE